MHEKLRTQTYTHLACIHTHRHTHMYLHPTHIHPTYIISSPGEGFPQLLSLIAGNVGGGLNLVDWQIWGTSTKVGLVPRPFCRGAQFSSADFTLAVALPRWQSCLFCTGRVNRPLKVCLEVSVYSATAKLNPPNSRNSQSAKYNSRQIFQLHGIYVKREYLGISRV